ncbi:thioredoxin-like protein [Dunaliella salina]|uniref:Thioredoxin-like protein n=1 Tax=Dunaliella salina TaxID=3046 RepID=A0ABQ7GZK5_DUNSA|nr:thioredoxin-like protein [Dunaliella salina]|eukprot:KAF5840048.1 thioredoxin-like protein [Dunaliella salina]
MTEYHTVYKNAHKEPTEWEDLQRKYGNLPPKEETWKPERFAPTPEIVKDKAWIDGHQEAEELSDLEDEFADDRFLEGYRQRRIQELKEASTRPRFGTVEEIRAPEFVQKVTEASQGSTSAAPAASHATQGSGADADRPPAEGSSGRDQEGVWVVVELYKPGQAASARMSPCIDELAARYPSTKFVRIVSTDCIPKYPDTNLPTLLVYYGGACKKHLVGPGAFGGPRITPEQVALVLNAIGPICKGNEEESGDLKKGEDFRLVRQLVRRVVAQKEEEDESSDDL